MTLSWDGQSRDYVQPVNMSVQAYVNAAKPDIGPDWQLRLQFQMLFPK